MMNDYYNFIELEGDQEEIPVENHMTRVGIKYPYKKKLIQKRKNIDVNDRIMHIIQLRDGRLAISAGSVLYIYKQYI